MSGFQPVMGTRLDLQITAACESDARAAEATVLAEAARLEAIFTVFNPSSRLCLWRSGEEHDPGPELRTLLSMARQWQLRSGGTFNPASGTITARWLRAEAEGAVPSNGELADLAASIATPRFDVVQGSVVRLGDCQPLDLNAIAKGHVVDLVAERVMACHDVTRLVLNAGGDLVHRGAGWVEVAVEDPARPFDNAPPLARIAVTNSAVATSGRSRRWFAIDGQRHSRVLDPRRGQPVSHTASATVVAPLAATADVVATAASVLEPADAIAFVDELAADGLATAALVVERNGTEHRSDGWWSAEIGVGGTHGPNGGGRRWTGVGPRC